eukprot:scaffold1818_cov162-Amphora_coffeaeformis.AAC.14
MPAQPRGGRRGVQRQPTGDDSDPLFILAQQQQAASAEQQTSQGATPRRGVRRQPTGDCDLELMAEMDMMDADEKMAK